MAPARGRSLRATAIQLFTKTPNQWRERVLVAEEIERFRHEVARHKLEAVVAHDSYLINLASPDPVLRARSIESFQKELERSRALGLRAVVSHPGNYMDDRSAGLERNAAGYAECLRSVPGDVEVWIEGTAGSGTALGARFEELRDLRNGLPDGIRTRVGFCLDTAHLHAVGYDLTRVEAVWEEFDRVVGFDLLKCLHLNDSRAARGARVDRHEWIAEGQIGPEPFRRIMRDPRLAGVVKIIETPKRDDPLRHDRRMLRRLRAYARGNTRAAVGV
jgi:deoxyribonuclease-4